MLKKIIQAVLVFGLLSNVVTTLAVRACTPTSQVVASDDPKGGTGTG